MAHRICERNQMIVTDINYICSGFLWNKSLPKHIIDISCFNLFSVSETFLKVIILLCDYYHNLPKILCSILNDSWYVTFIYKN